MENIDNDSEKIALEAQAIHFGQTPSQLLTTKHPSRQPKEHMTLGKSFLDSKIERVLYKSERYLGIKS